MTFEAIPQSPQQLLQLITDRLLDAAAEKHRREGEGACDVYRGFFHRQRARRREAADADRELEHVAGPASFGTVQFRRIVAADALEKVRDALLGRGLAEVVRDGKVEGRHVRFVGRTIWRTD